MGAQSPRQSLALAVVTGAVSTIPVWRAPRGVKRAAIAGFGLAAGAGAYAAFRRPDLLGAKREPVPARASVAIAAVTVGVTGGATALAFTLDRVFEQALVRRGIGHPRLVMGAAGAVLSYGMDMIDRRYDTPD